MSRSGFISWSLASILLIPFSLRASNDANPWKEIHSTHFTVVTDAGEKKGREVALRLEQMRAVFVALLSKDHLNDPVPLTILAFQNDKSFYQLAPLRKGQPIDVPGFLLSNDDQNFIALNLMEPEPWRAVAADLARLWLGYNYPPAQGWFDDGLVAYFSTIAVNDTQVQLGTDPELTPASLEGLTGIPGAHASTSFTELLAKEDWIPIADLFAMKHDAARIKESSLDDPHLFKYYAESWMVMHYLVHEKKLPETGSYLELVLIQHAPIEDAIQKAYDLPADKFEQAIRSYFQSLTGAQNPASQGKPTVQPSHSAALVHPDDSTITANVLSEPDARALYAEVQSRIPERREIGLQALKTLTTTATAADVKAEMKNEQREKQANNDTGSPLTLTNAIGNETAHRALAWDEIEHGQFDDALAELGDAASLNQRDMWVRYYLCLLKYRMSLATHTEIRGLANMLLDLRAVLEWYPEMANAYDMLGVAHNEGGTAVPAMQAERAAMTLSPRNETYVYHLAQIYISAKKWDAAQALLQRLKNSDNAETAKLAQDRMDEIGNERKYGLTAAGGAAHPQFAPQKSPFDVLEEDAAKRAAAEKTQPEAGDRRPTKFFKGRLVAVDCSAPPTAVLTISSEGTVLKLRTPDVKSMLLIGADDFSCDWRDRQVTVNYKVGGPSDGDVVSLEVR